MRLRPARLLLVAWCLSLCLHLALVLVGGAWFGRGVRQSARYPVRLRTAPPSMPRFFPPPAPPAAGLAAGPSAQEAAAHWRELLRRRPLQPVGGAGSGAGSAAQEGVDSLLASAAGPGGLGIEEVRPPKPIAFQPEELRLPDLDSLALARVREEVADRQRYVRRHLPDADTTDAGSERQRRARRVVERAIAAMGGWRALASIHQMQARVWIVATEDVIPGKPPLFPPTVQAAHPYPYPMAVWSYGGRNSFGIARVVVRTSLDPSVPNPEYLARNPAITRELYYRLFDGRWACLSPERKATRQQAEAARWHIFERFLGAGVELQYLGVQRLGVPVDAIQVEDDEFGFGYQALFDRDTGLLLALREELTPAEQAWYRANDPDGRRGAAPPVWLTIHGRYRQVGGVLTSLQLDRIRVERGAEAGRNEVLVRLRVAYNGEEPDPAAPDMGD